VSIRKRGKNYQIDYYCKGKRYREMIGPSRKEAEAVLGKRLNEIREGKFFGKMKLREILMKDLVREYMERFQGKKVEDEKRYMRILSNPSAENSSPTSTGGMWNRSRHYDGQRCGRMAFPGPTARATGKWRRSGGSSTRRSSGECWRGIPPPGSNPCRNLGDEPGSSPSTKRNVYWKHLRGTCGPSSSAPSKRECGGVRS
jgi:hypothetical protein